MYIGAIILNMSHNTVYVPCFVADALSAVSGASKSSSSILIGMHTSWWAKVYFLTLNSSPITGNFEKNTTSFILNVYSNFIR